MFAPEALVFCFALVGILILLSTPATVAESSVMLPKNIAVIGGGIGGTSATYFLREQFGQEVKIDLYEKNSRLCGRLALVTVDGQDYESGGSIIHPKNLYMKNFVKTLPGLKEAGSYSDSTFAIFDGEDYVMRSSVWSLFTILKMIWTFGISLFRLQWLESVFMDKFSRIYDLQSQGKSFDNVTSLLHATGRNEFVDATQATSSDLFRSNKIGDFMIHNLVSPGLRTNYGQNASANGFVGAVSMAGIQSGLWSVKGGNKKVCEKLIVNSSANLITEVVTSVKFFKDSKEGKFTVLTDKRLGETYDIVIIATPVGVHMSHIDLSGACEDPEICNSVVEDEREYRKTVANFVKGKLKSSLFKCDSHQDCPTGILVTNQETFYRSIGFHLPVDYESQSSQLEGVYKVFSTEPLTEKQRNYLFESYTETATVEWKAYPYYRPPEDLGTFVLNRAGLFYTSPMEWAASAMEMSVISAKNAALLAYNNWHRDHNPDTYKSLHSQFPKDDL